MAVETGEIKGNVWQFTEDNHLIKPSRYPQLVTDPEGVLKEVVEGLKKGCVVEGWEFAAALGDGQKLAFVFTDQSETGKWAVDVKKAQLGSACRHVRGMARGPKSVWTGFETPLSTLLMDEILHSTNRWVTDAKAGHNVVRRVVTEGIWSRSRVADILQMGVGCIYLNTIPVKKRLEDVDDNIGGIQAGIKEYLKEEEMLNKEKRSLEARVAVGQKLFPQDSW